MASLALSATKINILPIHTTVSGKFDHVHGGSIFRNAVFTKKRNATIVNVATEPPPAVLPRPKKEVTSVPKLAAWTSVKQERWEGELAVEGEIPQWLVCLLIKLIV